MVLDKLAFFKQIGYVPHPGQLLLHQATARHRTLACGSRWGKSICASREAMAAMLKPDSLGWVVGPTYELASIVFNEIVRTWQRTLPGMIEYASESKMKIKLINNAECHGKSADKPEGLLGRGVDWMICDEAAVYRSDIWPQFLQARLIDRKGWALFTSTPKGKGWYYQLYLLGQNKEPEYFSLEGPSWENPIIDKEDLMTKKKHWTERYWQQEVLGIFLEDTGAVFRNVMRHVAGEFQKAKPGEIYSIGADLAKHQDWTVLTVMDKTGHVVDWERLPQGTSWPMQKIRIAEKSMQYNNAIVYIDSSGIGDPIVDDLRAMRVRLQPVPTAQEKTLLIDALVVAMDNDTITFPELPILISELQIFEHEKTKTGRITYNAPEGFHDDAVISLALAWRGIGGMSSKAPAMLGWFEPRGPAFDFSQGRPI